MRIALCLLFATAACAPAGARVVHVDFDRGSDEASGDSFAAAFKHAPGDPAATGRAKTAGLGPGDVVRFAAGVRYRGTIKLRTAGAEGRPIVFESGPGGRAIIDGSDALPAPQPCRSAADCLGAPNWRALVKVGVPAGALWSDWLFDRKGLLQLGQTPTPADPFTYDDAREYNVISRSDYDTLLAGTVPTTRRPNPAGAPLLALWSRPNVIKFLPFTASDRGIVYTPAPQIVPYNDRDNRYAILNTIDGLTKPGTFVLSPGDGFALVWPRAGGGALSIGSRRSGFVLGPVKHVVIRGLAFEDMGSDQRQIRSGVAIVNTGEENDDLTIADNMFGPAAMTNGQGMIGLFKPGRTLIRGNIIRDIAFGSGLRSARGLGPLDITCNLIDRVGRTALAGFSTADLRVTYNRIENVNGIHGNGISAYLDNRRVVIADNLVSGSMRPLTVHGNKAKPPEIDSPLPVDIRITGNVLVGTDPKSAALSSWGGDLKNVTVSGNTFVTPGSSILVVGDEQNFVIENNRMSGEVRTAHKDRVGTIRVGRNAGAGGSAESVIAAKRAEISAKCAAPR